MRIGLFGGSFDPIHSGHLCIVDQLLKHSDLDEIWFCPAYTNPHKLDHPPAPPEHRLKMLELALEDTPFKILDWEINREGPSYTVDTVRALKKKYPQHEWRLVVGDDTLKHFKDWKEPDVLVEMAPLLVVPRFKENPLQITPMDVSSTEIRVKLRKGESCEGLLPAKVIDYILKNQLYSKQ